MSKVPPPPPPSPPVANLSRTPIVLSHGLFGFGELSLGRFKVSYFNHIDCDGKVIIIAHSMGGLDARYMISRLGMADRVAALVTLSTPHHGSPYADWCLKNLGMKLGAMKVARLLGLDVQAIADLSTESCR